MVEALSVMQKKSQTRKWIMFYNKKNYYWDILSTYETKSGNEGFILRREITKEENDEIKKGLSKIVNNVLINIDYVQGKVHPKEKRG